MFSSVLGFDPEDVFLPEAQRELDDDYLIEYEERQHQRRKRSLYYDLDSEEE